MNERIKELANRAMVEREDGWHEFDPYVFAELLIRECLDVVAGHCGGDTDSEPVKIFLDIEKHFGVDGNS